MKVVALFTILCYNSYLQCLELVQLVIFYSTAIMRHWSLYLSAISLPGRDEETCKFSFIYSRTDDIRHRSCHLHSLDCTDHLCFIEYFPDFGTVGKFQLFVFGILFHQIYFPTHACMYCVTVVVHFILRLLLQ